ncbi:hypothetical protein V1509DRAFT_587488 [Lipomyces kononenkoae]
MSSDSSTPANHETGPSPPTVVAISSTEAAPDAVVSGTDPSSSQKPQASATGGGLQMHSQRACTQCQRHKIKCVSDGLGPCIRCRKKGFLCHIAPRKKRVSKKNRDVANSVRSTAGTGISRTGRDSLYDAESDDDEIMDESDSQNTGPRRSASRPDSVNGGNSGDVRFSDRTRNGNININPTYSGSENEIAGHDGKIPLVAGPSSANEANGTVWLSPESMASTPPRPILPHKSPLPEYMKQSTISSCSNHSIYLSLSFLCPELFRRTVDMDWHQNPVLFASPISSTRPLFRSLVDSPTSPVYALAFENDPAHITRYNLPSSPEDEQTVADWRKQYGPVLLDVYFNLINPTQPIIHRRHFMAAYDANKESVMLLLAIFAVSVPYCTLGTLDERRTLQTKFIQHLFAHFSYKLMLPTMDAVQTLSLIADSCCDRGVLMPHAALVSAAVELRLHMDCSHWDIPGWERALRKAIWQSICIRDAWTVVRFVGTPKVISEYYDAPVPTATELSQLTMNEGEDAPSFCTMRVNQSHVNCSMESCLRSFISVANLSEILLEANRSLYQLKGIRYLHQQPAAAASHIAESLESRLQEVAASWLREESVLMEPDLNRWVMFHFVRLCIYSQFLPHQQGINRADRYLMEFYTRFLDAIQGCIDTLNKFKNVKYSSYWPPWLNQLVLMQMFVLYDVLIAIISRHFKTHGVPKPQDSTNSSSPHADEPKPPKKTVPMPQTERRALLLEILNKDRFSAMVLQYSSELMVTIGDLAASWDHPRELYKKMLQTTRSFGMTDVIDAPGMAQFMQSAVDAAKAASGSDQQSQSQQQQSEKSTQFSAQAAARQQTPPSQDSISRTGVFQPSPSLPMASPAQPHTLQQQPSQIVTSSQTLLPPVYHLPTVGPWQNNYNPSLQSLFCPALPNGKIGQLPQPGHQQSQSSSYDIAQILNRDQPVNGHQAQQRPRYDNTNSSVSPQVTSTTQATHPQHQQQQQSGFVGQFGDRLQQNLYEEAAGIANASHAGSGVQNVPAASDNVAGSHAIGAFDDFFTNLSANLFEGLADFHRDFIF